MNCCSDLENFDNALQNKYSISEELVFIPKEVEQKYLSVGVNKDKRRSNKMVEFDYHY